jgi:hypothetical protein
MKVFRREALQEDVHRLAAKPLDRHAGRDYP